MTARYLSLKEVAQTARGDQRRGLQAAQAGRAHRIHPRMETRNHRRMEQGMPPAAASSAAAAAHASTRPNNKKTPFSQPCGWEKGYIQVLRQGRHSLYLVNRVSEE